MHFNGRLLRTVVMAAGLVAAAGLATGALADTKTDMAGSGSGTLFTAQCPPGNALIGIGYNYYMTLMAVGPLCQPIKNGQRTGEPLLTPDDVYGAAADQSETYACKPEFGEVRSIGVSPVINGKQVHHISINCATLGRSSGSTLPATKAMAPKQVAGKSTKVSCPDKTSYATGLFGTYEASGKAAGIHSLGLICRDASDDDQTADTGDDGDQDTADTGDHGDHGITIAGFPFQLEINIGPGQNGLNFGPKGKVRRLHDDSTVYSDKGNTEVGYLERGDRVTVVGCEKGGKGWCQIVRPMPGLVWGGDLE
jgi:hypothetical protein